MTTIEVTASRSYPVEIGHGLLDSLGSKAAALVRGSRAAIVSDSAVYPLYGGAVQDSLAAAGFQVCAFVFPQGEQSKNGETYLRLLSFLAEHGLTRADLLVALGGGVTGDLTGFAAATYLRGVAYVQVPTTLLAMVDSSVGGKTAIDLPAGKNLAGAFYQPSLVLCDTALLATLPRPIFRDGCAEAIKYGILRGGSLFRALQEPRSWEAPEDLIAQCITIKRDTVGRDEFDTGCRQLLNLGHTIGHAVEAGSGFSLSHGQSIAVGMAAIARAAVSFGLCAPETRDAILDLLGRYDLPTTTDQTPEALCAIALGDKKRQGNTITLAVPREIGRCELLTIPVEALGDWIREGIS